MDDRQSRPARSLRVQLSLWIAGAILVVGCAATGASFYFAFGEAHALQDETLKQIGGLVGRIPSGLIEQTGILRPEAPSSETVAIVRLRQDGDTPGSCGVSRDIAIPCGLGNGWHTIDAGAERWRVLVTSNPSGVRFAVAQPTALRDEIARDGSLRTLVPILCLMVALVPLVALVIRRMLSPIAQLAKTLDHTRENAIRALPREGIPSEISPFVVSINRLLARLSESMAQQRRFVADAAHELRSPLTALTLQVQNLDKIAMTPDMRTRVNALRAGLSRGTRLVSQLLSLARLQQGATATFEWVPVQEVVHQIMEEAYSHAESKQIDLGVERLEAIALNADRLALHTVLRNLVDNAIRYTPEGGRVDLRIYREDDWVHIEVQDNGPGIATEDLEHVRQPFFRATGTGESGSGLGLAIASDMARVMDGELNLYTSSSGLLVRLRLPWHPPAQVTGSCSE